MDERYHPKEVEEKWQKVWESQNLFKVTEDPKKAKYYLLEMFPYPSGKIHMGHVRNYSIVDVVARYKKMKGFNVLLDKIDHETGLDKYGAFTEKMRTSIERAEKFEERFAVIILDVDNFKTLMKTYGHETSLVFLKELGDIVKQQLRGVDIAGRYGFDEIIILLSKTNLEEALHFARSLANAVEAGAFTSHRIKSTISIGVAAFPENGRSVDKLLTATKNAVFEAQRAGRNKVFHYTMEWDARDVTLCEHT